MIRSVRDAATANALNVSAETPPDVDQIDGTPRCSAVTIRSTTERALPRGITNPPFKFATPCLHSGSISHWLARISPTF
jgi:hypothetical protein